MNNYSVEPEHENEGPRVIALALKMAWDRGGQTTPLSSYDIDRARERITGEVDEIAKLRGEIAALKAKLAEAIDALRLIMSCTAHIHNGKIVFDCGDPYQIAAQVVAKHGVGR